MATETPERRRPGRPLPAPDPESRRRAHRLVTMADVGALLRAERANKGLSQADMATTLGLSRQSMVALERGAEGIGAGTLLSILAALGIVVLAFPAEAAADPRVALGLGDALT